MDAEQSVSLISRDSKPASKDVTALTRSVPHASKNVSRSATGSLDRTLRTNHAERVEMPKVRHRAVRFLAGCRTCIRIETNLSSDWVRAESTPEKVSESRFFADTPATQSLHIPWPTIGGKAGCEVCIRAGMR